MSLEIFKTRVLPVKDKLYRFAKYLLNDEEEAMDVVQEVLIKVWNNRENMDQLQNMEAWCMKITRNLSLDRMKTKYHKMTDPLQEGYDRSGGEDQTPYYSVEMNDTMKSIGNFIQALPEKQRQVIQLRDVEGYSYSEIADILEIDINQVKVNLFRARKAIKGKILKINAYGLE